MQSCCVFECDSYKSINDRRISYFKFPLHDEALLEKWLLAIDQRNWKPNTHTQICEIHFKPNDIERPLHKYPSLTPTAIPSIFPNRSIIPHVIETTDTKLIQRTNTPVAENNAKTEILLSPVLQGTPVILTPGLIDQIPTINQTLVPVSNNIQRFRKILPKVAQNNSENQQNPLKRKENSSNLSSTTSNPYIIIIPTFDNTKSSITSSVPRLPLQSNKKPILKITVGRRLRKEEYLANMNKTNGGSPVHHSVSGVNSLEEAEENKDQEIVINNYSLKKSVVYTLDSITGDIKVTHRPLKEYSSEPISKVSDSHNETRRRTTRNFNNQSKTNAEIISQFKESFIKTRQSYDKLMKRKLMMLKPVHKTDEIERLEKELLKFGSSVNNDKLNNKLQETKRRYSSSSDEDSNSLDKVFVLENLLKKNEVVIKKMKTPSITTSNGEVFINKNLPNKESDLFHSENEDKINHACESNTCIRKLAETSNIL
ncbi:THAP domain-containing protein 5-like [Chelonus insularis]|uniref:THAP domain-containing protein 5-like n=1 Tax=Chelonus insularis TaxID=460826 RepID=UPI0015896512|nr:THAP domain-containing protein 5-like [Chelonus insularis]